MADIRCPMCGKPNPAEAESCWSCQARLKPVTPSGDQPGEAPDWLSGLRASDDNPDWADSSAGEAEPAGETPDWLARIRQQQSQDEVGDEEPDWMRNLSADQPEDAGEAQEAALPDWLSVLRSEDASQTPPADPEKEAKEDADWMANLASWSAPVTPAESPSPDESEPAGDDQGWLNVFRAAPESTQEPLAQPAGDELDWLSNLGQGLEPPATGEQPELPARPAVEPVDDKIDWLSTLGMASEPSGAVPAAPFAPETPEPEQQPPSGEDLDWLSQLTSAQPAAPGEPTAPEADLSDWFSGVNLQAGANDPPAAPEEPSVAASPFTEEPPAVPGETPDWLKVFGEQPAAPPEAPGEEIPAPAMPFSGADMPAWLDSAEEGASATEKSGEEAGQEGLEAAQLPGWLQAMRPVEALAPVDSLKPEEDQSIVKAGPLAGMAGILPGKDVTGKVRRPPVYSARLRVSENQRLQANLLEQMLSEEAKPRPARAERSHIPQRIVRLLIAVLLLVVTTLPLVTSTQIMPLPNLFPPETVNFRAQVEALPENAPVLLAVDYEPGLSEEMNLASASVLDHLMSKQARLALLSTTPTGPVLADTLLRAAAARNSGFQAADGSVNLGFLPGGTAGLQEFASRPQVALQYQLNGEPAWEHPALGGVTDIRKFAAVIVLTENAETARAWIEQVQPRLEQVPLLFVISAQSAPFIHPYIDSAQVAGMVEGMAGGIAYARIAHQPAGAAAYWDSYQFGLFAAVALLLLGALWQLIRSLAASRSPQKGA